MTKPSPETNLRMAWAVIILGIDQHEVGSLFSINQGRVNEAVQAVRRAIEDPLGRNHKEQPSLEEMFKPET